MITFAVSPVDVATYNSRMRGQPQPASKEIVSLADEYNSKKLGNVLKSSPAKSNWVPKNNGFVRAVVDAYNSHHNLDIRPDDVWLAILIQFGRFVERNAEKLRTSFVKHQGQKELEVFQNADLRSANYAYMTKQFIDAMKEHLVEPELSRWVLPSFSTTTNDDKIVASVVMMATMKSYFSYKLTLACGIPFVTLLGTVNDWVQLRARINKLRDYDVGGRMTTWTNMLAEVLDNFVLAARGKPNISFWQRICHSHGGGSGPSYLSGWISVFCVFDKEGKWQGSKMTDTISKLTPQGRQRHDDIISAGYPMIEMEDIPSGYLYVDVKIDDNGIMHKAILFGGHMSYRVHNRNTIAPHLSWAIALRKSRSSIQDEDNEDDQDE